MKRRRNPTKPPAPTNLRLEEVVGLTTKNGNGLASNASSSKFAYIAGCVVVLYNVHSGVRSHLTVPNRVPKPLSCVTLSLDASIVAAGESGRRPGVWVWNSNTLAIVCELKGHQYGVACMAFSPDGKYLASVGFPHDGCIYFWDWKNRILAARVKISSISCPTASIEFSSDSKFVVTADKNQLKFWKVRWPKGFCASARTPSMIMHRKVELGHHKNSAFVAVTSMIRMGCSSVNHIHADEQTPFCAVTEKGILCMVHPGSSVINSVDLEVTKCFALSASPSLIACACNEGIVKLFCSNSLKYAGQLVYGEGNRYKQSTALDYKMDVKQIELQSQPTFPDAIACQFSTAEKLVVIYDDHSLYIWDVYNIDQGTRCCVLVSHGGCIWGIKNVPCENMHDPSLSCVAKGCSGGLSFATCSVDGNIRLWDFVLQSELSENSFSHPRDDNSNGDKSLVKVGIFERDSVANDLSSPGFRSIAVSSDGKYLAAGDRCGDIHIFDVYTSDYIFIKDSHDSEIRCLSFNLADKNDASSPESLATRTFLASVGGQDGRIHLYDVDRNFNLFGTIDHHSAVTSVKVSSNGCQILSCTDRYLILHDVDVSSPGCKFSCLRRIATSGTIYDMVVDHQMEIAFTVGEDKKISVYNISSGKRIKWFTHDGNGDAGDPVKVATDGSCSYVACSYANRYIYIYDYISGNIVAQAAGHGKFVTDIIFLPDCKHLVSVGADGCIFVWRLPADMSSRMLRRTKEKYINIPPESINQPMPCNHLDSYLVDGQKWKDQSEGPSNENSNGIHEEMVLLEGCSPENVGFKFNISQLPKWAQCKVTNNSLLPETDSISSKVGSQKDEEPHESANVSRDALESAQKFSRTLSGHLANTESSVSPSSSQTFRTSENRWLTIHTVCMGLLDSPDTYDLEGLNAHISATDSTSQSQAMEVMPQNKRIKLTCPDPCIRNPPEGSNHEQHDKYADASGKDSQEKENDKTNSHSLSSLLQKDEENSSAITCRMHAKVEISRSCKEALHNLEVAADHALQSVYKWAAVNPGVDISCMAEAATRLPSIEKKIQAITELFQPARNLK